MLPKELLSVDQWVLWRLEKTEKDRPTKRPYRINGTLASSTDPTGWMSYLIANDALTIEYDGIGFMAGAVPFGFILIDLDHCLTDNGIEPWAQKIIEVANTYTEISPSGDGIHCFLGGQLNRPTGKKTDKAEIYDHARYFTITENVFETRTKFRTASQSEIDIIYSLVSQTGPEREESELNTAPQGTCVFSITDILERMTTAKNGAKTKKLLDGNCEDYGNDQSRADLALCCSLAFWTCRDGKMIDTIFRQSKLYREKWDSKRGNTTYGWLTINQAITHCKETYSRKKEKVFDVFWYTDMSKKYPELKISYSGELDFIINNGFAKYYSENAVESGYVKIKNRLVEVASREKIVDYVIEYVQNLPYKLPENEFTRNDLYNLIISKTNIYLNEEKLKCIKPTNMELHKDKKDRSAIFFNDFWADITKDNIIKKPYSELDGYIWKRQKIKRNYPKIEEDEGEWSLFCCRACGNDPVVYESLKSAIGYLIHRYKNPAQSVAITLLDATISDVPSGRSGKSLIMSGIEKIRNVTIIDGKSFDCNDRFAYQNIAEDTDVVVIDDIRKRFVFENIFHLITGDFGVETKGNHKIIIPFDRSPKIGITSNYMLEGEGPSFEARIYELALLSKYNKDFTPEKDFCHKLFLEWDETEWNRFDSFMMKCLREYLNRGLIYVDNANIPIRKAIQKTSPEFVSFCDSYFEKYKNDEWQMKKEVYNEYVSMNETDHRKFDLQCFGRWLATYMKYKGGNYETAQKIIDDKRESCFRYIPKG